MAKKIYDLWMDRFYRDISIKNSVIIYGNTLDIMYNQYNQGRYETVLNNVVACIKNKGYTNIVVWDRADGINKNISKDVPQYRPETQNTSSENSRNVSG